MELNKAAQLYMFTLGAQYLNLGVLKHVLRVRYAVYVLVTTYLALAVVLAGSTLSSVTAQTLLTPRSLRTTRCKAKEMVAPMLSLGPVHTVRFERKFGCKIL